MGTSKLHREYFVNLHAHTDTQRKTWKNPHYMVNTGKEIEGKFCSICLYSVFILRVYTYFEITRTLQNRHTMITCIRMEACAPGMEYHRGE